MLIFANYSQNTQKVILCPDVRARTEKKSHLNLKNYIPLAMIIFNNIGESWYNKKMGNVMVKKYIAFNLQFMYY